MKQLAFDPAAAIELDAAIDYYEARTAGVGRAFSAEVEQALASVCANPQHCAPVGRSGLRKHILLRFPYVVFFRELSDSIWIAAVAHGSRRPGYWKGRRPPG